MTSKALLAATALVAITISLPATAAELTVGFSQIGSESGWRADLAARRILFWMAYAPLILSSSDLVYRSAVLNGIARAARHLDRSADKAPLGLPRAPNFAWSPDYYARVAATVDQLVIMAYDTALPTSSLYRRYVSWAARSVAGALDKPGSKVRVLMGIPTYEPYSFMHRRGVETPENALAGVVAGLRGLGAGGTFEGVAIYAEWTTDEKDWRAYERHWRNRTE